MWGPGRRRCVRVGGHSGVRTHRTRESIRAQVRITAAYYEDYVHLSIPLRLTPPCGDANLRLRVPWVLRQRTASAALLRLNKEGPESLGGICAHLYQEGPHGARPTGKRRQKKTPPRQERYPRRAHRHTASAHIIAQLASLGRPRLASRRPCLHGACEARCCHGASGASG